MPIALNNSKPKIKLIQRARDIVNTTVNLLKPDIFFGVFIVLSLFKQPLGFYLVFIIFIIAYFSERIIKMLKKKNALDI
jgi:hypothetical protein